MTIKVLSYNVSWESMTGKKSNWFLCKNNNNQPCVNNIKKVIESDTFDFILLQEATNYHLLLDSPQNSTNYYHHQSGKEDMITIWDKKYVPIKFISGEFSEGRPWQAIFFKNNLLVINLHAPHLTYDELLLNLNKMLKTINNELKIKNYRIIMGGDFNYILNKYGKSIILNKIKFYMADEVLNTRNINSTKILHIDHILDTLKPTRLYISKVDYMASDHKPIIGILQENLLSGGTILSKNYIKYLIIKKKYKELKKLVASQ